MLVRIKLKETTEYIEELEMTEEEYKQFMLDSNDYESAMDYGMLQPANTEISNLEISYLDSDGDWQLDYYQ